MSMDGRKVEGRDVEQEIGRVLQGLSEVQAPLGLEGRVLLRVAEARSARGAGWVPGLVLAAACAMAAVVWAALERPGGDRSAASVAVQGPLAGEHAAGAQGPRASEHAAAGRVAAGGLRVQATPVPLRGKGLAPAVRNHPGAGLSAYEGLALEEMRAPSRPEAPPPLTAQEQMLVRVAEARGAEAFARADSSDEVQEGVERNGGVAGPEQELRREGARRDVVSVLRASLFAGMTTGSVASDE